MSRYLSAEPRRVICRFDLLRAADPVTRVVLNRYPDEPPIGVAVYVKGRGLGLRWFYLGIQRPPTRRAVRRAKRQLAAVAR